MYDFVHGLRLAPLVGLSGFYYIVRMSQNPSRAGSRAFADIRCLTFDLDDTLWDCAPVIAKAEQACYAWLAENYPRITAGHDLESLRTHRLQTAERHANLKHDVTALRLAALKDLAEQ